MPRRKRIASATGVYHFINRGVNKKRIFHQKDDYRTYLALMAEHARDLDIQIYHYCLMSNHTHILLRSPDMESLSRFGHYLQRRYAYYYSRTYHWPEQVFRKRFISLPIKKDSYLLECGRYIERNPVRAKLVEDPKDFHYSSYGYYGLGFENKLIAPNPLYEDLGFSKNERILAYRDYIRTERPYEEIVDEKLNPF
jgi:putative transposase